jgi:hypothetical protein
VNAQQAEANDPEPFRVPVRIYAVGAELCSADRRSVSRALRGGIFGASVARHRVKKGE